MDDVGWIMLDGFWMDVGWIFDGCWMDFGWMLDEWMDVGWMDV